jgi:hypothetical protein
MVTSEGAAGVAARVRAFSNESVLMERRATAHCNAGYGERTPERTNACDGSCRRSTRCRQ